MTNIYASGQGRKWMTQYNQEAVAPSECSRKKITTLQNALESMKVLVQVDTNT